MAESNHHDDPERRKRELRAEIARSRRRINDSLRDLTVETKRLTDWRLYARKLALPAAGAALVVGYLIAPRGSRSDSSSRKEGGARPRSSILGKIAWAVAKPALPMLAQSALAAFQLKATSQAADAAHAAKQAAAAGQQQRGYRPGQPAGRYQVR